MTTTGLSTLPPAYQKLFSGRYDGYPAATFESSSEYHNVTTALRRSGVSFKTKIQKQKRRRGVTRKFIVMAVPHAA
jgi:acetyl-CoA acetyltransferase